MAHIYPSLLAANQDKLMQVIKDLEPHCAGFHIDIMDNKFVPNTGISVSMTNDISRETYRQLWVHLMVEDPESYLEKLQLRPQSIITFHMESHKKTKQLINGIIENKCLPGIAVSPKTGIDEVFPFLDLVHQVLIMSVEPGFAGQPFLDSVLTKIDPLLGFRATKNNFSPNIPGFRIAMDGGISAVNIQQLVQKGVDQLAVGSDIFKSKVGPVEALQVLQKMIEEKQ